MNDDDEAVDHDDEAVATVRAFARGLLAVARAGASAPGASGNPVRNQERLAFLEAALTVATKDEETIAWIILAGRN